jgi:uncharacterized protein
LIAVDTNMLVYAHRTDSVWHEAAFRSLQGLAGGAAPWGIPWPCVHEFYSVVTHPRIYSPPSNSQQAIDQIEAWFEAPNLVLLSEEAAHWSTLKPLLSAGRVAGPLVHDARIAALCLANAVTELWTADRDFSRFTALKTRNVLVSGT